jgi:hypothetical protein
MVKGKYIGQYIYDGTMKYPEIAKRDVHELLERYKMLEVRESFSGYMQRVKNNKNEKLKIKRIAPLIDLTLDEMDSSFVIGGGAESLLERLEVNKVIVAQDELINPNEFVPVTRELIYNYDFGDNWLITITKHKGCDELLMQNIIDVYEFEEAEETVINKHKPVCINKDGMPLLDDVGGLGGFADFLETIYEGEVKEESDNFRRWAKSLGWNDRKVSNKMML